MHLIQTLDAGVLELRLNRPGRLNALTLSLASDLLAAVRAGEGNPAVRAILISGEGRAFCAGKDRDDPATAGFVDVLQALASALVQSPKPVVTAVQGWVVGAGLELMLNGDLAVAARSARFVLPEVQVGLFGTGGVATLLPRLVGLQRAKGLLMLGQEVDAETAGRWGLVWQVVDDDALATEARQLAQRLAGSEAALLAEVKQLVHAEQLGDFHAALARETAVHARLQAHGVEAGPTELRYGAEGEGPSIYLTDPEGNVVELKGPPSA